MGTQTPQALWERGVRPDGSTALITVRVCLAPDGGLYAAHESATPEDDALVLSWPGGGHRHVAHALLIEAVRREAFVCLMALVSDDTLLAASILAGSMQDPAKRKALEERLVAAVTQSLTITVQGMALPSVKEAINMLTSQIQPIEKG